MLKKKYIILILIIFTFIPCNAQKGKARRYFYKFIYSVFNEKDEKSYNRKTKNNKGSNSFSKNKRRVVGKTFSLKSDKKEKSYNRKFRIFSSSSRYSSKNRKMQNKPVFLIPDIQIKAFSKRYKAPSSTSKYSAKHKRMKKKIFFVIPDIRINAFNKKLKSFIPTSKYSSKHRRVEKKTPLFSRDIRINAFNRKLKSFIPTSKYSSKHRRVVSNEHAISFRPKGLCERKDSYGREWHEGSSSFTFSRKLRKVVKKRVLGIFTVNKREGENLSFRGADYKKNKFYTYKKKEKRIKHPRNFFGRHKKESESKPKKPQMRLFPKSMYDFQE
ncbi:MAG: hypothetical protein PHD97_05095 [Bacteroidales bacterium]|nr:hypothetical protein [Bacteroidales bacterium]